MVIDRANSKARLLILHSNPRMFSGQLKSGQSLTQSRLNERAWPVTGHFGQCSKRWQHLGTFTLFRCYFKQAGARQSQRWWEPFGGQSVLPAHRCRRQRTIRTIRDDGQGDATCAYMRELRGEPNVYPKQGAGGKVAPKRYGPLALP